MGDATDFLLPEPLTEGLLVLCVCVLDFCVEDFSGLLCDGETVFTCVLFVALRLDLLMLPDHSSGLLMQWLSVSTGGSAGLEGLSSGLTLARLRLRTGALTFLSGTGSLSQVDSYCLRPGNTKVCQYATHS